MIKLKIVLKKEVIMFSTLKNKIVGFVRKIKPKKPIPCGGHEQPKPPNGRNLRVASDEYGRPNETLLCQKNRRPRSFQTTH